MDGIEHVSMKYDLLIHIFLFECQAAQRRAIFFSAVDFEPWLNGLMEFLKQSLIFTVHRVVLNKLVSLLKTA